MSRIDYEQRAKDSLRLREKKQFKTMVSRMIVWTAYFGIALTAIAYFLG